MGHLEGLRLCDRRAEGKAHKNKRAIGNEGLLRKIEWKLGQWREYSGIERIGSRIGEHLTQKTVAAKR